MSDQRKQILQMLAEGKITADEAEQLIAALDREQSESAPPRASDRAKPSPKYLRVTVNPVSSRGSGPGQVNVRVPLQLLRAGVKLASLVPAPVIGHANEELRRSGLPFDLSQLKPDQLETLIEHLGDMTIDVEQPDVQVKIFVE